MRPDLDPFVWCYDDSPETWAEHAGDDDRTLALLVFGRSLWGHDWRARLPSLAARIERHLPVIYYAPTGERLCALGQAEADRDAHRAVGTIHATDSHDATNRAAPPVMRGRAANSTGPREREVPQ